MKAAAPSPAHSPACGNARVLSCALTHAFVCTRTQVGTQYCAAWHAKEKTLWVKRNVQSSEVRVARVHTCRTHS